MQAHIKDLQTTNLKWAVEFFDDDSYHYCDYIGRKLWAVSSAKGLEVLESTGVSERIIGQLNNIEEISSIVEANLLNEDIDFVIKE